MGKIPAVGVPLSGTRLWPLGAQYVIWLATALDSGGQENFRRLFLVATDDKLDRFYLYQSFLSQFQGVIYFGKNPTLAKKTLGSNLIHCSDLKALSRYIDRYLDEPPLQTIQTVMAPVLYTPDTERCKGNSEEAKKMLEMPDRFVYCFNPFWLQKGHIQLFRALALLNKAGQQIHLVCEGSVGNPNYAEYIEFFQPYIKQLELENLVHFLCPADESTRLQLIRRSQFVIQPGNFTGLPVLVKQCKTLGKRIILSDPVLQQTAMYGMVTTVNEPLALAANINKLLQRAEAPDSFQESAAYSAALREGREAAKKLVYTAYSLQKVLAHNPRKRRKTVKGFAKKEIVIATSIAPRDIDDQSQAISTWLDMGFRVVSMNSPAETDLLQPYFPKVEFAVARRNAGSIYGKPFIFLNDIFDYFDRNRINICGIVNSDIHFRNSAFYGYVLKEAKDCLVYGSRVEIKSIGDQTGIMDIWGYDYFFFDRHLIPYFPRESFCLGLPWWDLWMPVIALGNKLPVKRMATPHAFHVSHNHRYDQKVLNSLGHVFSKYFAPPFPLSDRTMHQYGIWIRLMLNKCSAPIALDS